VSVYPSDRKELFSHAYVIAVAAAAGYAVYPAPRVVDNDGVDLTIAGVGLQGTMRSVRLDVQVKSTSSNIVAARSVNYPLDVRNHEQLSWAGDIGTPRILIVVTVPADVSDWTRHSEEELCLKRCGYWLSLRGDAPTANKATITVTIPRANAFTLRALETLMQRVAARTL